MTFKWMALFNVWQTAVDGSSTNRFHLPLVVIISDMDWTALAGEVRYTNRPFDTGPVYGSTVQYFSVVQKRLTNIHTQRWFYQKIENLFATDWYSLIDQDSAWNMTKSWNTENRAKLQIIYHTKECH